MVAERRRCVDDPVVDCARHPMPTGGARSPAAEGQLMYFEGFDWSSPPWLTGLASLLAVAGVVGHYVTENDWIIAGAVLAAATLLFIGEAVYNPGRQPEQPEDRHSSALG